MMTETDTEMERVSRLLQRICMPVACEIQVDLRERASTWRARNLAAVVERAGSMIEDLPHAETPQAHPRLVSRLIEGASWADDGRAQDFWAGLLASSCAVGREDDSNLPFIDLLSRMTVPQMRILAHLVSEAEVGVSGGGWLYSPTVFERSEQTLLEIAGICDPHRLARELDYLAASGLIDGGFESGGAHASLLVTPLGLEMYARCRGRAGDPADYYARNDRR